MWRYLATVFFLVAMIMVQDSECISNDLAEEPHYQQHLQQQPQQQQQQPQQWPVARGWVETARNFVRGPMGQMAVQMAKEMVSRSAGNSQILSLNFTNLLILVLLKTLIFVAATLGAGNYGYYGRGRSIESNSILREGEPSLLLGFLAAEGSQQDGCLLRAACRSPEIAADYVKTGRALLKGMDMFDQSLPYNARYNHLIQTLEQATLEGMEDAPCEVLYGCNI